MGIPNIHEPKSGLRINAIDGGKMSVEFFFNGETVGGFEIDQNEAGILATQVLSVAIIAHQRTGVPTKSKIGSRINGPFLEPSTFGLAQSQKPNHEVLVVRFGEAEIGLSIPHAKLRELGQALVAASAAGGAQ